MTVLELDVSEETPWWEWSENVVFLAEFLVAEGADGATILAVFQRPWEFSTDYGRALTCHVDDLIGVPVKEPLHRN